MIASRDPLELLRGVLQLTREVSRKLNDDDYERYREIKEAADELARDPEIVILSITRREIASRLNTGLCRYEFTADDPRITREIVDDFADRWADQIADNDSVNGRAASILDSILEELGLEYDEELDRDISPSGFPDEQSDAN